MNAPPKLQYLELQSNGAITSFNWIWTLPPGLWWWQWARLTSVVTDANVANRMAHLEIYSVAAVTGRSVRLSDQGYHTAGNTRPHFWWAGSPIGVQGSSGSGVWHHMPQWFIIPRSHLAGISISDTQAGDTASTAFGGFWKIDD